jgi:hypothetical protein
LPGSRPSTPACAYSTVPCACSNNALAWKMTGNPRRHNRCRTGCRSSQVVGGRGPARPAVPPGRISQSGPPFL